MGSGAVRVGRQSVEYRPVTNDNYQQSEQQSSEQQPSELLTVGQAARSLGVHPNTVRKWSNQGLLQPYRVGPRGDRRFRRSDVERLLEARSD